MILCHRNFSSVNNTHQSIKQKKTMIQSSSAVIRDQTVFTRISFLDRILSFHIDPTLSITRLNEMRLVNSAFKECVESFCSPVWDAALSGKSESFLIRQEYPVGAMVPSTTGPPRGRNHRLVPDKTRPPKLFWKALFIRICCQKIRGAAPSALAGSSFGMYGAFIFERVIYQLPTKRLKEIILGYSSASDADPNKLVRWLAGAGNGAAIRVLLGRHPGLFDREDEDKNAARTGTGDDALFCIGVREQDTSIMRNLAAPMAGRVDIEDRSHSAIETAILSRSPDAVEAVLPLYLKQKEEKQKGDIVSAAAAAAAATDGDLSPASPSCFCDVRDWLSASCAAARIGDTGLIERLWELWGDRPIKPESDLPEQANSLQTVNELAGFLIMIFVRALNLPLLEWLVRPVGAHQFNQQRAWWLHRAAWRLFQQPSLLGSRSHPIYYAAAHSVEVLNLLISFGPEQHRAEIVNYSELEGSTTPLIVAVLHNRVAVVRELLFRWKADPHKRGENGANALDFAALINNETMIRLLQKAGAKPSRKVGGSRSCYLNVPERRYHEREKFEFPSWACAACRPLRSKNGDYSLRHHLGDGDPCWATDVNRQLFSGAELRRAQILKPALPLEPCESDGDD